MLFSKKTGQEKARKLCSNIFPKLKERVFEVIKNKQMEIKIWEKDFFIENERLSSINETMEGKMMSNLKAIKYGNQLMQKWNCEKF